MLINQRNEEINFLIRFHTAKDINSHKSTNKQPLEPLELNHIIREKHI